VNEGDSSPPGRIVARDGHRVLDSQRREAERSCDRLRVRLERSHSLVAQREAEKVAPWLWWPQRETELKLAQKRQARSDRCGDQAIASGPGRCSPPPCRGAQLGGQRGKGTGGGSGRRDRDGPNPSARGPIVVEAARATIERLQADIDDSTLRTPRDAVCSIASPSPAR